MLLRFRSGPVRRRRPCLLSLACALTFATSPALAQSRDTPADPFDGIVSTTLANGLTVWLKPLRGAGTTSISVAVPHGSDRDPPGREELAHVVEHALFSTRDDVTSEQIAREITDRGGTFNASTSPDRTFLWVSVAREHGPFALEWLYRRLEPREWEESIMPGVRAAVLLELGAGPRSALTLLRDRVLLHPALVPAGFWTREFGLHPPEYRRADVFQSVNRTSAADVERFYRRYYSPEGMTLLVVGDFDPTLALADVQRTFGQLPIWFADAPPPARVRLRPTPTRRFLWNLRQDVRYTLSFRLDSLAAPDYTRLLFAQQLLERRLLRRLRWGEQQAVYAVHTALVQRGQAALLRFEVRVRPQAFQEAKAVIDDEIQRLRHGRYPPGEFEQDRAALDLRLRLNNANPTALRNWHSSALYRPEMRPEPPALGKAFAATTSEQLAAFARARLAPDAQILSVERPLPLREGAAAALPLVAIWLGVLLARRWLRRPVELARLRYLARIRPPLPFALLAAGLIALLLLLALRLLAAIAHHAAAAFLWTRDSFLLQAGAFILLCAIGTLLVCAVLALVPRRILVLEHEVRIKYLAYRSRVLRPEDIESVRLASFAEVFGSPQVLRTVPLTPGWPRPGALIRTLRGPDWFVATRDSAELVRALERFAAGGPPRSDVWLR